MALIKEKYEYESNNIKLDHAFELYQTLESISSLKFYFYKVNPKTFIQNFQQACDVFFADSSHTCKIFHNMIKRQIRKAITHINSKK